MAKPSRKVVALFAEVEMLADQLTELTAEEERLRDLLMKLWRQKTLVMANLAAKACEASQTEVAECMRARKP